MNRIFIFMAILLLATNVYSKGVDNSAGIKATTYSDGVLFEVNDSNDDVMLSVSGPNNMILERKYSSADPIFISVDDAVGGPLRDGLYKYEARTIPAFTISREESSKLRDRNTLIGKSEPKSSPVSGNFRIENGMVVDANLEEFDAVGVKK